MCGRFYFDFDVVKENIKDFDFENVKFEFKKGEIFPSNNILVKDKDGYDSLKWGVQPEWSKHLIINARLETVNEKRFFKSDFKNHPCVIISTSYFEWTNKQKKEIKTDNPIIFLAGFYKIIDEIKEAVILTKEPQNEIRYIHNRMPVILNEKDIKDYLDNSDIIINQNNQYNFSVKDAK